MILSIVAYKQPAFLFGWHFTATRHNIAEPASGLQQSSKPEHHIARSQHFPANNESGLLSLFSTLLDFRP